MQVDILTLFPQMFAPLDTSIIKRARDAGVIKINLHNFRDHTTDKHRRTDDSPFGGGAGLVLTAQPIVDCIESIDPDHKAHRIFMSPAAPTLTQKRVCELAKHDRLILLCGHYEGVDQRAIDLCIDECISIGEYVLTGGELPAMVLVDAVARHVPGVIKAESLVTESHSTPNYHEHPHYTRPSNFRGKTVPQVLLDGNHKEIEKFRKG
ncbi:MAG: tRNA (guanosine(37)-N1)-methyltransferase TrmD [Christensenellaceae bacterium]|jgi:tRNA (guanine37-N1)-methyltransferase|nr:tRNA (guanosine(37)-N1)-methyltransferase TrmD [Christensenellaceae bacterium]